MEADYELGAYSVVIFRNSPVIGMKKLFTTRMASENCTEIKEENEYQVDINVVDHFISFDKHDMEIEEEQADIDYFIYWRSFYSPNKTNALQMSHIPDSEFDQK